MTAFAAALSILCLTRAESAVILVNREGRAMKESLVVDYARGKTRVPDDVWQQLSGLFEMVEIAADKIIAAQEELDDGAGLVRRELDPATVDLDHPKLRGAAIARAMLVLGPRLLRVG